MHAAACPRITPAYVTPAHTARTSAQPYPNLGMVLNEFAAVFAPVGFADLISIYFREGELGRKYFQVCPKCPFMVSTCRWYRVARAELCALCTSRGRTFQLHFLCAPFAGCDISLLGRAGPFFNQVCPACSFMF